MTLTYDEETLSYDAYSSAGAVNPRATLSYTRVYRKGGQYAHLEELIYSAHSDDTPEGPPLSWDNQESWYGTGSQDEYEHAAAKPLCPKCFARREAGQFMDHRLGAGHGVEMR